MIRYHSQDTISMHYRIHQCLYISINSLFHSFLIQFSEFITYNFLFYVSNGNFFGKLFPWQKPILFPHFHENNPVPFVLYIDFLSCLLLWVCIIHIHNIYTHIFYNKYSKCFLKSSKWEIKFTYCPLLQF